MVFLEFYKQFVFLNSNKQNDGTTECEIRGRRGADLLRFVEGLLRFVVVRGALPRDPDAQLQNFSWDLLANHKCDPTIQKTAGIMIPAPTVLLGSDQHPSCGPGLARPLAER